MLINKNKIKMPAITQEQIQQEVYDCIKKVAERTEASPEFKFSLDTSLEELPFDSLDIVDLQMQLEDRFDIKIPDKSMKRLYPLKIDIVMQQEKLRYGTVGDLAAYIYRRLSQTKAA